MRTLRFPVYVIANKDGILVATIDGRDCVLMFDSEELAANHIATNDALGGITIPYPVELPDLNALRQCIQCLPPNITCALWDGSNQPDRFRAIGLGDLIHALSEG